MPVFPKQWTEERKLRFETNAALLAFAVIGVIVACVHGGARTTSVAAYGAALGLGGILGFLFGIPTASKSSVAVAVIAPKPGKPKGEEGAAAEAAAGDAKAVALEHPDAAGVAPPAEAKAKAEEGKDEAPPATSSSTSNLEQVADWVTKLLLGGGLTQMQRIPPKIWQWSRMLALGILQDAQDHSEAVIEAQQAFAAGLLVYGFVLGFFGGFLITKLQLGKALRD